jgi:hypothetical protein
VTGRHPPACVGVDRSEVLPNNHLEAPNVVPVLVGRGKRKRDRGPCLHHLDNGRQRLADHTHVSPSLGDSSQRFVRERDCDRQARHELPASGEIGTLLEHIVCDWELAAVGESVGKSRTETG